MDINTVTTLVNTKRFSSLTEANTVITHFTKMFSSLMEAKTVTSHY